MRHAVQITGYFQVSLGQSRSNMHSARQISSDTAKPNSATKSINRRISRCHFTA